LAADIAGQQTSGVRNPAGGFTSMVINGGLGDPYLIDAKLRGTRLKILPGNDYIVPSLDLLCVLSARHYIDPMQYWLALSSFNR
jgi:hypothetical protein